MKVRERRQGSGGPVLLEGSRPALDELFLPGVEERRLQANLIAQFRDRLLVLQMPPPDAASGLRLSFRRVVLPLLLHTFAPLS